MEPDPKPVGLLFGGTNPVAVERSRSQVVGFDPYAIPCLRVRFVRNLSQSGTRNLPLMILLCISLGLEGFEGATGDISILGSVSFPVSVGVDI